MGKCKLGLVLSLIMALLTIAGSAGAEVSEQKITRLFSYDPHPSTAEFTEPAPFKGELLTHEVVFHETWKTIKNTDCLQSIYFSLRVTKGGTVVEVADSKPFNINGLKKGQQAGEAVLGTTRLTVSVDDFVKTAAGITDVTLTFTLSYPESKVEKAELKEANIKTSTALDFCRKLAERANKLPATSLAARLSIYQKALAAAPAADFSPQAAEFHQQMNALISELSSGKPVAVTDSVESPATPAVTPKVEPANPEAARLLKQARTLLSQGKGPEGREALRKALEIAPDYREALILLGDNAYENRKYNRAKEAFDKVINLDERDADSLLKYFKACYYNGEGPQAILRLAEINRAHPDEHRIKFAVAQAYFQLGDMVNAEVLCNEILASNPGNYGARDLLERVKKLNR